MPSPTLSERLAWALSGILILLGAMSCAWLYVQIHTPPLD